MTIDMNDLRDAIEFILTADEGEPIVKGVFNDAHYVITVSEEVNKALEPLRQIEITKSYKVHEKEKTMFSRSQHLLNCEVLEVHLQPFLSEMRYQYLFSSQDQYDEDCRNLISFFNDLVIWGDCRKELTNEEAEAEV